jgi:hypothetical protein
VIGDQWLPQNRFELGALIVVIIAGASAGTFTRRGLTILTQCR